MRMDVLSASMHHVAKRTNEARRRSWILLGMELQMVVSFQVGDWNETQVLWNSSRCS